MHHDTRTRATRVDLCEHDCGCHCGLSLGTGVGALRARKRVTSLRSKCTIAFLSPPPPYTRTYTHLDCSLKGLALSVTGTHGIRDDSRVVETQQIIGGNAGRSSNSPLLRKALELRAYAGCGRDCCHYARNWGVITSSWHGVGGGCGSGARMAAIAKF